MQNQRAAEENMALGENDQSFSVAGEQWTRGLRMYLQRAHVARKVGEGSLYAVVKNLDSCRQLGATEIFYPE